MSYNRLKILIHLPNNSGGKKNYFLSIKDQLKSAVHFSYCGSRGKNESIFNFIIRNFRDLSSFYGQVRDGQFDLVVINPTLDPKSFFRDSIFTLVAALMGQRVIIFWHGWRWAFERRVVRNMGFYFRMTYGRADAMIVLAQEFKDKILSYRYHGPVYLETTTIDHRFLNGSNAVSRRFVSTNKQTILFLSRVERAKGIYETIKCYSRLSSKYNIELQIAGTGSELDAVQHFVMQNNIDGVKFLGWITGDEKIKAYLNAQIYLLPSYSEGMPISLLEAMACGLPVITTRVGGIKDFFVQGKMGFLVQPKDELDLEQKLDLLLSDSKVRRQLGEYNWNYARESFSPYKISLRLEEIFAKSTHQARAATVNSSNDFST